jgi:hypothetical protein
MKCGHVEIDGIAFCSGLDNLDLFDNIDSSPSLKATIDTATHLIRAAPFRSRNFASVSSERFSLDIGPLGQLVDMYCNRKATDRRDKIFALLGMSNDNWQGKNTRIAVDYKSSWDAICRQFFQILYSREISANPWRTSGITAVEGRAQILGQLAFDEAESLHGETLQEVDVRFCGSRSRKAGEKQKWRLQVGANPVRPGDVVCLLRGASRFTIIRPDGLDWIIVRAAVGPPVRAYMHGIAFPYELELLWDWQISGPEETKGSLPVVAGLKVDNAGWQSHLDGAQRLRRLWPVLSTLPTHELLVKNLRDTILHFGMAVEKGAADVATRREAAPEMTRFADQFMDEIGSWTAVCLAAEGGQIPALSLLLARVNGIRPIPETVIRLPAWLARMNKQEKAREAVARVVGDGGVTEEMIQLSMAKAVSCNDIAMADMILRAARAWYKDVAPDSEQNKRMWWEKRAWNAFCSRVRGIAERNGYAAIARLLPSADSDPIGQADLRWAS